MISDVSGMLHDVLDGFVVYRSLVPADDRLPSIKDLRSRLGLKKGIVPRKSEPSYAIVVAEMLREASVLLGNKAGISRLIYVGDTMRNDVSAFSNLCRETGWTGRAFIADERSDQPRDVQMLAERQYLTLSNQWSDIAAFLGDALAAGYGGGADTAVVVDIDKTLLGARGRNDHVIDKARQQAAYEVTRDVGGEDVVDRESFGRIYDHVNRPAFHSFTEDNQDAVAYTCLLAACGLISMNELTAFVASGQLGGFRSFVLDMDRKLLQLGTGVAQLHERVCEQVRAANPTVFTSFRCAEYRCTAKLMGCLPDDALRTTLLDEEIVITEEVWMAIKAWRDRGCIIFGVSDKPDEACFPPPGDSIGSPIHCLSTHIVGGRR